MAVLSFRRLPAIFAIAPAMESVGSTRDKLFLGWFGPLGVGTIYYAFLAERRLGGDSIWEVTSLLITASVLVHGVSATWGALQYPKGGRNGERA